MKSRFKNGALKLLGRRSPAAPDLTAAVDVAGVSVSTPDGQADSRPRDLDKPIHMKVASSSHTYALVASCPTHGVFVCRNDQEAPEPEAELDLICNMKTGGSVRLAVGLVGEPQPVPGFERYSFVARWQGVSSRDRANLVTVLTWILRLEAKIVAEEKLSPATVLIYDPKLIQVRVGSLDEMRPSTANGRGAFSRYGLQAKDTDLRAVRVTGTETDADTLNAAKTIGRTGPRPRPVFQVPQSESRYRNKGKLYDMVFGLAGETHCVFVVLYLDDPKLGDTLEVAVPTEPMAKGFVWIKGRVTQLRIQQAKTQMQVEIELSAKFDGQPAAYRKLVEFFKKKKGLLASV